jgi:hypothetical protein
MTIIIFLFVGIGILLLLSEKKRNGTSYNQKNNTPKSHELCQSE